MRFSVITYLFYFTMLLVIARLWYWQVLKSSDLIARAENQRLSSKEILAPRGSIFFSDGTTLASTQPVFLVYAQPKVVKDKEQVAEALSKIFWELDKIPNVEISDEEKNKEIEDLEKKLIEKLSRNLYWVSLGRRVNNEIKSKIEKYNFEGIGFETSTARFYPEGSSSAHLLGFVGSDVFGLDKGYFGLEGFYNGELRGKNGLSVEEKDALGLPILIGDFNLRNPKIGKTLVLNIDKTIQTIVEDKLKSGLEKYGAKEASAIVMDPKTGNILAMASLPNYDPSRPGIFQSDLYKNPLTADAYEPGSTFKVLVMAAAFNENLIDEFTKCDNCEGPLDIGDFTIRTWNNKYYPNTTMTDVIVHSDNTGMVFVSKKLGIDKMFSYLERYGFGKLTDVDLEDEIASPLRTKKNWREIDLATASFGQGIAVTAMQMIKAVSTIANDGKLMEPHVVKIIRDEKGDFEIKPRGLGQPITKETAKKIKDMMVKAVEEGEAKYTKLKGFKIAGKTGTAQIPVAGHYDANKTIASFIGFAPADDPKFIILVRYKEPSSSIFGSETAAPTFFEIAKEILIYYGIAPTE